MVDFLGFGIVEMLCMEVLTKYNMGNLVYVSSSYEKVYCFLGKRSLSFFNESRTFLLMNVKPGSVLV